MSVVGVVSGYYIFNDIFKQVSDEESGNAQIQSNMNVDTEMGSGGGAQKGRGKQDNQE